MRLGSAVTRCPRSLGAKRARSWAGCAKSFGACARIAPSQRRLLTEAAAAAAAAGRTLECVSLRVSGSLGVGLGGRMGKVVRYGRTQWLPASPQPCGCGKPAAGRTHGGTSHSSCLRKCLSEGQAGPGAVVEGRSGAGSKRCRRGG